MITCYLMIITTIANISPSTPSSGSEMLTVALKTASEKSTPSCIEDIQVPSLTQINYRYQNNKNILLCNSINSLD